MLENSSESFSIDIVVPVFNEAEGIKPHIESLVGVLRTLDSTYKCRLLLVDDGSQDGTYEGVKWLCAKFPQIRAIRFTRNFGKESAIAAGLQHCTGDAAIVMDSDMQHPPALISEMLSEWRKGALVVEGIKRTRGHESFLSRMYASGFYWLFGKLAGIKIENTTDFKLLDRCVIDLYLRLPERTKFFRGLVAWMGHKSVRIPFDVQSRKLGTSVWSRQRLLHYAWNNICSFSGKPLRFIAVLGGVGLCTAFVFLVVSLAQYVRGVALVGFPTVIFLVVFLSSLQLVALGLLGSFVSRIYEETKGRPSYVVTETSGFDAPRASSDQGI